MNKQYYIGLDVHKDTIGIAYISSTSRQDAIYHRPSGGSSQACERALRKLAKKLDVSFQDLIAQLTKAATELQSSTSKC